MTGQAPSPGRGPSEALGSEDGARGKAGVAALLLLLTGFALGLVVDRVWLLVPEATAMPLTAEALVSHLDLLPSDEARVRALLDSMHADVTAAAAQGPDALAMAAQSAHQRIEAALPPDARPGFRAWVEGHHRQMMERMGGGAMMHDGSMMHDGPGMHDGSMMHDGTRMHDGRMMHDGPIGGMPGGGTR